MATATVNGRAKARAKATAGRRDWRRVGDRLGCLRSPIPLMILDKLRDVPELNVGVIAAAIGRDQPTISHHLCKMRSLGLLERRREGKGNIYAISAWAKEFMAAVDRIPGD